MLGFPAKCSRCGTSLKKQVLGSNTFYYCRKCGCTTSVSASSTLSTATVGQVKA
ncbi:hypothetical protein ACSAZK_17200 [Methanosarcina sp. Mfa9]|uniref:hypothetical protein n=1 Tax=Methanosarcina sp. Mfa9 TaxID=3439063 RepID=UPI003F82413F